MERQYNFRSMKATDVFKLTSILAKIGVKDIKGCITNYMTLTKDDEADKNALALNLGVDIVEVLLSNIDKCEEPIYKFLASVTDLTERDIKGMEATEFITLIYDLFAQKEYLDFFKVALRFQK